MMAALTSEYLTDLERKTKFYLGLIKRIDEILKEPIMTLTRITSQYAVKVKRYKAAEQTPDGNVAERIEEPYFPVWMSARVQPEPRDDLFTKSLCIATLLRVQQLQRRSSWLEGDAGKLFFSKETKELFAGAFTPEGPEPKFKDYVDVLTGNTFGALDPLTASQVFNVFLHSGEEKAHSGIGNLAFFAMVWPLHRRFPDRQAFGAAIEPWQPKAYVTAKCVLPIKELQGYCSERAELLEAIGENLRELEELSKAEEPRKRWLFNAELDDLWANVLRLKRIVIGQKALESCAEEVREISDDMSQRRSREEFAHNYEQVRDAIKVAFTKLGVEGVKVIDEALQLVEMIKPNIVNRLTGKPKDKEYLKETLGLKLAAEYADGPDEVRKAYFDHLRDAANKSYEFCRDTLRNLRDASKKCADISDKENPVMLKSAIEELAEANRKVAAEMNEHVDEAAVWCRTVLDREIAHASARNFTDFDPSELVSAIAVATRWNQMTTTVQVSDAVSKAVLTGAREDGSWAPGQPFFSPNHALGIWPMTSDIVWALAGTLKEYPQVEDADEALFRYVDWLERTQTTIIPERKRREDQRQGGDGSKAQQILDRIEGQPMVGWMSDRLRYAGKIHFAATAFSINALLEIRDLLEYRLWQLCEKRFTVVQARKGLKAVDPTDLGAIHSERLHRHLSKMARDAQDVKNKHYANAEYSLVLHGPPGSSKTFIAKAFSFEMWKATKPWGSKGPRFLQITPADFTRLGEDRLDSEARLIFDLLSGVRGVTIFFDEIDDILRQRHAAGKGPRRPTFMELVVPAMLNRLADLREACPRQETCFLLATNYVDSIEPALIRKGRIDRAVAVVYPDRESRRVLVGKFLEKLGPTSLFDQLCAHIVAKTPRWPYLTIESLCDDVTRTLEGRLPGDAKAGISWEETEEIISSLIEEHQASFTPPNYAARRADSQALFNEYMGYLVCGFAGLSEEEVMGEFDAEKTKISVGRMSRPRPLDKELLAILKKQKRISS